MIDRIREGIEVICEDQLIGKVNRVIKNPEWKKTEFFTINTIDKEVLLPIEVLYEAKDEKLYLNITLMEIEKLPDICGKEICNQSGYVFHDLRAVVYEILDLPRPFLDYY